MSDIYRGGTFIERRERWRKTLYKAKFANIKRLAVFLGINNAEEATVEDLDDLISAVASKLAT